ncbi:MAG: hypothetical protein GQ470_00940 [Gammaproteobacteria bacterium]|nr:hypothetical protein [Gammaproteobacteria bacterium]
MILPRIAVFASLLLIAACGSTGAVKDTKPKWILETPTFPGELHGSGSAEILSGIDDAKVRAKESALANLLSELELTVQASTTSRESLQKSSRTGEVFLQQVDRVVQTRIPEYELRFVKIKEHFVDKPENRIYVLVRLDLDSERGYLRDELSVADNDLAKLTQEYNSLSTTSIAGLRKISAGLLAIAQRETIKLQLNRLNKSAKPLLTEGQQHMKRNLAQLLANVTISIEKPVVDKSRKLYAAIVERLTSQGIKLSDGTGDINIRYEIDVTSVERDGVVFGFADGDVWLMDRNGEVILSFKARAKGSSVDPKLSQDRVLNKLARRLADEIVQSLF